MNADKDEIKKILLSELKESLSYKEFKEISKDTSNYIEKINNMQSKVKRLKMIYRISLIVFSIMILSTLLICMLHVENYVLQGLIIFTITLLPTMVLGIIFNKTYSETEKKFFILELLRKL